MAQPVFTRPKSLYIEAIAVLPDGSEQVYKMKYEAKDSTSELVLALDNLFDESEDYGIVTTTPNGVSNVKVEFTRCVAVAPVPAE